MTAPDYELLAPTPEERQRLAGTFRALAPVKGGSWRVAFARNPVRAVAAAGYVAGQGAALLAVDGTPRHLGTELVGRLLEPLLAECRAAGLSPVRTVPVPEGSALAGILVACGAKPERRLLVFEGTLDGLRARAAVPRERMRRLLAADRVSSWGQPTSGELGTIASLLGEARLVHPRLLRIDFTGGEGGYDPALAWVARRGEELVAILLCTVRGPALVVDARWAADSLAPLPSWAVHLLLADAILAMAEARGCTRLRFLADAERHRTTVREAARLACPQTGSSVTFSFVTTGKGASGASTPS